MELRLVFSVFVIFGLFYNVQSSKIYFDHYPSTLRFGESEVLRLSELGDVVAGSLGYTTISTWPGLTVTSPFGYPLAFVLVNVISNDYDVEMDGKMYHVKQETSLNSVYKFVQGALKSQSETPISFQDITLADMLPKVKQAWLADPTSLDKSIVEDDNFVHQMEVLPSLMEKMEEFSTTAHGGKDVTFIEVESMNPLVAKYGANSSQVQEAGYMLRKSLMTLMERAKKFYGDRLVFATVFTDDSHHITKRATFTENEELEDVNLATPYSEDFPVVFNIVLFLSIVLIFAIIAAAASVALMDPGHDSIIYRMTNPRMKKD